MKKSLNVNGFSLEAEYEDRFVRETLIPLLTELSDAYFRKRKRQIVFLAGPPAAGKSTLALFLEYLSSKIGSSAKVQALSMDGYHYPNAYLDTHCTVRNGKQILLRRIKGAPETYDTMGLKHALEQICQSGSAGSACTYMWPGYDRTLHDVVPGKYAITGDILLIEGNYLLLEESPWKELRDYADDTVFVNEPEDMLKERLVARKIRGGSSDREAEEWYANTDASNIRRVLKGSVRAGHEIMITVTERTLDL